MVFCMLIHYIYYKKWTIYYCTGVTFACFEAEAVSAVRSKQTEMNVFNTFCPGLSMKWTTVRRWRQDRGCGWRGWFAGRPLDDGRSQSFASSLKFDKNRLINMKIHHFSIHGIVGRSLGVRLAHHVVVIWNEFSFKVYSL